MRRAFIGGDTPEKVHDIYLENVNMTLAKRTDYPGGVYDKRPCKGEGFINDKTYGVYVENASNISIKDCKIIQGSPAINDFGGEVKKINVK